MPWFWIIAGPNGAGKSTMVEYGVIQRVSNVELVQLNADVRARAILSVNPRETDAALLAAREIDAAVVDCIDRGIDFLVETVLSTDKISRRCATRLR
jgi:predicted ABC-type ATPase